ncbi:uncharacterized protein BP01DRAFT_395839 [Aspergillus saccharolyticus JOP 1030-1]|uniref:Uncharacterized protein n=1 Tax=Aspergillus saccharolyticus JOP 1030-1 TaxID=1450539 RepID=A0A318Z6Z9_9EURO|nr:hypothetical protein BP01DRAFT_395839 [Aspergillus saccharolyticus JOP 1030-1]PYH40503.1 hypothetical protein BP01DRAFT_395839 [Aspergillus saccharolyticus JOP 1030-1]
MPVQWTAEADAKLFVGVLNQCQGRLKLDSRKLADYMGGDCTACAVEQRMTRLKRLAKAVVTPGVGAAAAAATSSAKRKAAVAAGLSGEEGDEDAAQKRSLKKVKAKALMKMQEVKDE